MVSFFIIFKVNFFSVFSFISVAQPASAAATNASTPMVLDPPPAPVKDTSALGESFFDRNNSLHQSPLALDLSNIERSADERRSTSFNNHRLERQNALVGSPEPHGGRYNDNSNDAIVDAIERNTSQLRMMFNDLSQHVDEIERRIQKSEGQKSDSD